MYKRQVLNGYNGNFRPDDSITRGEMAAILNRIMQYSEISSNTFADLDNNAWYTDAILRANAAGVMTVSYTHLDVYKRQVLVCWSNF